MIWLIGDRGMLGQELSGVLKDRGMAFIGSDREVDIRDIDVLRSFARDAAAKTEGGAQGEAISWIINCSAYTAVDRAEDEEEIARSINAAGAGNIATVATELGARMIHISTDYVFRGDGKAPYLESDPMDPAGAYGRTKAEGERLVAAACPEHYIIRTAWLYGKHGPNFAYTMLKLMRSKEAISVVSDQKGTPTWAFDLASAMADIVAADPGRYGTYHFTNEGQTDWHGFAAEIHALGREFAILERDCGVAAITSDQYPSKVKRPAWSVLSKEKIRRDLGVKTPEWKDSLRAYLKGIGDILRRQRAWRVRAEYDLKTAEVDFSGGQYSAMAFWCQQAVEKELKSLVEFMERPSYTHDLMKLARFLRLELDEAQRAFLKKISAAYRENRYDIEVDSPIIEPAKDDALSYMEFTKGFLAWIRTKNKLPIE